MAGTPAIAAVRDLLKKTVRILTSDNRVFIGTFVGTDQLLNILLMKQTPRHWQTGRFVGHVMVPWRLVIQVGAFHRSHDGKGKRREQNGGGLYI